MAGGVHLQVGRDRHFRQQGPEFGETDGGFDGPPDFGDRAMAGIDQQAAADFADGVAGRQETMDRQGSGDDDDGGDEDGEDADRQRDAEPGKAPSARTAHCKSLPCDGRFSRRDAEQPVSGCCFRPGKPRAVITRKQNSAVGEFPEVSAIRDRGRRLA